MRCQAVDFPALALRPFMARVARSVRKLPAVTAKRLQNFTLCDEARRSLGPPPMVGSGRGMSSVWRGQSGEGPPPEQPS
jgi:hypothetical protein